MHSNHLHFFVLIIIFPVYLRAENGLGWISNCKARFNITSGQCSNGIWLDRDIQPGCICIKGLWVLNSKLCDYNDLLLFGNGDCFYIEKRIRKISFLGAATSAFSPVTFVSEKSKKLVFQQFQDTRFEGNQAIRIVRINPETDYYYHLESHKMECVDKAFKKLTPSLTSLISSVFNKQTTNTVSIIKVTRSPSFLEFRESSKENQCHIQNKVSSKDLSLETLHLSLGQGVYLAKEKIIVSDPKCSEGCEVKRREKRFLPDPNIDVNGYYGHSLSAKSGPFDQNTVQKYIQEQNVRIIKNEINFMKYLQTPPDLRLNDTTYQFLQMSRLILNTICPLAEVPEALSKSLTRLFRFILLERRDNNLYGKLDVGESEHAQVMKVLETCYNESAAMEFTVKFEAEACRQNPNQQTSTDTAGSSGPYGPGNVCNCSRTYTGVKLNETINNACTGLNETYEWAYPNRDFIIESMWKTFQFAHYQCAKFFSADGGAAAVFHERLERLFHADVIFRWLKPSPESEALWEYFYMGYNTEEYATAMDTCLCAAQYWSEYPRPMVRPVIPVFKKKRSLGFPSDEMGNEIYEPHLSAQCLQHPWDPVQNVKSQKC